MRCADCKSYAPRYPAASEGLCLKRFNHGVNMFTHEWMECSWGSSDPVIHMIVKRGKRWEP